MSAGTLPAPPQLEKLKGEQVNPAANPETLCLRKVRRFIEMLRAWGLVINGKFR